MGQNEAIENLLNFFVKVCAWKDGKMFETYLSNIL
jgi:hypothetical protein